MLESRCTQGPNVPYKHGRSGSSHGSNTVVVEVVDVESVDDVRVDDVRVDDVSVVVDEVVVVLPTWKWTEAFPWTVNVRPASSVLQRQSEPEKETVRMSKATS